MDAKKKALLATEKVTTIAMHLAIEEEMKRTSALKEELKNPLAIPSDFGELKAMSALGEGLKCTSAIEEEMKRTSALKEELKNPLAIPSDFGELKAMSALGEGLKCTSAIEEEMKRTSALKEELKNPLAIPSDFGELKAMSAIEEEMKRTLTRPSDVEEELRRTMAKVPNFDIPSIMSHTFRFPEIPQRTTQSEVNEYQSSSVLMQVLAEEASDWKERLPENYKPAILAVLYGGIQIYVQTLAKVSFHGIRIDGTMNGAPCSLLAHQSTVQLLCYAEEVKPDTVRNPIGFVWDNNKIEV